MVRLFVAVDIPDELKAKIGELGKGLEEPGLLMVAPKNLHVTLQFLGETPEERVPEIVASLKKVEMAPFEVEISGAGAFPSMSYIRVVWLDCKGPLSELAVQVVANLQPLGFVPDKPFVSHLTISRVKRKPEKLKERLVNLQDVNVGKFTVNSFSLKKSTLTPQGPIYEDVAVFELKG